jgi:hypothetical protein
MWYSNTFLNVLGNLLSCPSVKTAKWETPGNPYWRGRLSTVDLLIIPLHHYWSAAFEIANISYFFAKQDILMRWPIVLSHPFQLVFLGNTFCRTFAILFTFLVAHSYLNNANIRVINYDQKAYKILGLILIFCWSCLFQAQIMKENINSLMFVMCLLLAPPLPRPILLWPLTVLMRLKRQVVRALIILSFLDVYDFKPVDAQLLKFYESNSLIPYCNKLERWSLLP